MTKSASERLKGDNWKFAVISMTSYIFLVETSRIVPAHITSPDSFLRLQDCVVRVPFDTKVKRKTIQMAEKFQPVSSDLTLKERKEARSLRSVNLSDDEIGNRRNCITP
ncbi:hypothetical protein GQR58_003578 [Nymphon striatum]|nr:hypothetical protein GQR58_003578 [Nymphon striatum]